jgi:hypothetical protein
MRVSGQSSGFARLVQYLPVRQYLRARLNICAPGSTIIRALTGYLNVSTVP